MKSKFSSDQVFPFGVGIVEFVFSNTVFLGLVLYELCTGKWIAACFMLIPLLLCVIPSVILLKTGWLTFQSEIQTDASGIRVVSRKGKIKRELHWEDIKKYSVCGFTQNEENYICLTENPDYPGFRMYYPGVVWGLFYDKRTLTVPFSHELYETCQKYIAEKTTLGEPKITGHISSSNASDTEKGHVSNEVPGLATTQKRTAKRIYIMLAVSVVVLILIFYLTFKYGNVHF